MANAPEAGRPGAPPPPGGRRALPVLLAAALLALLALAALGRVVANDFIVWDDLEYVVENPLVLPGLTWEGTARAFTSFHSSNWHPLTWLSHMLDVELFGLRPAGHHLTSLLIHAASAVLLLLVLHAMTGALPPSALVAALFAVHPLHVQSVAWVAERKDVLSGFFWMLTLAAWLAYARRPGRRRYLAVLLAFALGLMAKPMLVTLPLVLILLDFWPLGRLPRPVRTPAALRLLAEKAPLLLLSAASSAVTVAAQAAGHAIPGLERLPPEPRVWNAFLSYLRYVGKAVVPRDLAIYYPHPGETLPRWAGALCLLALALLTARALRASRRRGYPGVGWLWFLVTLLPVIGVVQVGTQAIADRYTYLPLVGLFLLPAWAARDAGRARPACTPVLAGAAAAAVALLAGLSWREAGFWRSSLSIADRSRASTGDNVVVLTIKGVALLRAGRLDEAVPLLREAARLWPDEPDIRYNLASALARRGDRREAIENYRRVLAAQPGDVGALVALGRLLSDEGEQEEALRSLLAAEAVEPRNHVTQREISVVLERLGRVGEAVARARRAAAEAPSDARAQTRLGVLLARQGDFEGALAAFSAALALKPADADALYNLGRLHDLRGDRGRAVDLFRRALAAAPDNAGTHVSLGAALMDLGKTAEAVAHFREALRLEPGSLEAQTNLMRAEGRQREERLPPVSEGAGRPPDP